MIVRPLIYPFLDIIEDKIPQFMLFPDTVPDGAKDAIHATGVQRAHRASHLIGLH